MAPSPSPSENKFAFRTTGGQDRVIEKQPFWRRHWRALAIGAVVMVVLAWLAPTAALFSGARRSISLSRVTLATVERGTFVRDIEADGKVVAAVSPTLYAPAPGSVTLQVHAGDVVKKDQVLARVDSPDLTARLSQEQSALHGLTLDYQRAQLDARMQLLQAQDNFQKAQVDEQTAKRELERSRKAYELGAFSELQMLKAQDELEKAEFVLTESDKALKARPEQNNFDINEKKSALDRQQFVVADMKRQVDALNIASPVDGQVGQVQIADRASVAKDAPLLTVVDLSALEVEINVPESFARDLAVGMNAELSGTGGKWQGKLGAVSPEVVNGQVTARVRFDGAKPDGLRQSQRLSVRVLLDQRDQVLMVDRGTFLDQDGGAYAYVVTNNIAEKHPIRVGASSISKVEILDGLKEGDQIVVSGTDTFDRADRIILSR